MSKEHDELERWARFARTLAGEATSADAQALRDDAALDGRVAAEYDAAASTWHATAPAVTAAQQQRLDVASTTQTAWERLQRAQQAREQGSDTTSTPSAPSTLAVSRTRSRRFALAAGVTLVAGLFGGWAFDQVTDRTWTTYAAAPGHRTSITLADGSAIVLRGGSTVRVAGSPRVPALAALRYGALGRVRAVQLDGEASFDVVHDVTRPFRVTAAGLVIEDIGTRFNVRAYAADRSVAVAVTEGAVTIGRQDGRIGSLAGASSATEVRAGESAAVDAAGVIRVAPLDDAASMLAWTTGRLVVRDRPLRDVVEDLSRTFGETITVADAAAATRTITLDVPLTTLESTLRMVAAILDLTVTRVSDGYVLRVPPPLD